MAQGRSARLVCAAERTDGELCATAWKIRLFSDGGSDGSMAETDIIVCRLRVL